ncbi:E3 ubiquitin-protein ligase Hakai-like [Lytechinus variegatus]|uniref:E3 ubiquitin-protein ligase Hakai-like n=1 Tax=Lytechinus variegatus TaxID=7654 RepID=UPI001BB2AA69|nr:E3 ubiquitin-protein ligase Hakai-like [Lytechinus variegatus]
MDSHNEMYPQRFAMHRNNVLKWDYKLNLVGRKDPDPKIHNCEKCSFPIMSYGRMIPCKHVFCFDCAKATDKSCLRCEDPVQRIEQSPLGSIYLCAYGAPKHCHTGCRRTYLSQRDLLAHIHHRHLPKPMTQVASSTASAVKDQSHSTMSRVTDPRTESKGDPRSHQPYVSSHSELYPGPTPAQASHIMPEQMPYEPRPSEPTSSQSGPEDYHVSVPVRKSNLITVPLHDSSKDYQQSSQVHGAVSSYPSQAPIVPVQQQQHQGPPPPPPPQHVAYPPHLPPSTAVPHVPISHPPPVSGSYTGPPISGHQVMHIMHPQQAPVYSQGGVPPPPMNPHYDSTPRPSFQSNTPIPVGNAPFPAPGVPIPRPGWPVGPPPTSSMPPPPQTNMPPPPPPSQVPTMVNQVPSMPPPQAPPGARPEMGPPPPPMGPPMTEAPRYHGQYFS